MQEITPDESLSSRTKGKILTYEEKKEIQLKYDKELRLEK